MKKQTRNSVFHLLKTKKLSKSELQSIMGGYYGGGGHSCMADCVNGGVGCDDADSCTCTDYVGASCVNDGVTTEIPCD